jgi:acyl-CoA thioester hydrolase
MKKSSFETYRGIVNQFDINFNCLKESSISRILEEAMIFSSGVIQKKYDEIIETKILNENKRVYIDPYNSIYVHTEFNELNKSKIEIIHNLYLDKSYFNKKKQLIICKSFIVTTLDIEPSVFISNQTKNNLYSAYKGIVRQTDCDQMSHMNVQFYFDKHSTAIKNLFNEISIPFKKNIAFTVKKERCIFSKEVHLNCSLEIIFFIQYVEENELKLSSKFYCLDNKNISAHFETIISFETESNLIEVINDIFLSDKLTYLNKFNFEKLRKLSDKRPPKTINKNAFLSCKKAVNTWDLGFDLMGTSQFKVGCVSDAATHFFTVCGADYNWRTKYNIGSAALDYSVRYYKCAPLGMAVSMYSNFTKIGNKSLKFIHHMVDDASGDIIMDIEIVAVLFDLEKRVSMIVPESFKNKANSLLINN